MKSFGSLVATGFALITTSLIGSRPAVAEVWTVSPGESINAAIQRADVGDTVLVRPGIYRESVRLKGGIVLRGQGGAESTWLVASSTAPVVTATGSGTRTLDGFTIDGDYEARVGVAIDLYGDGAVAITNSRIVRHVGPGVEAFLYGWQTRLALSRNEIGGNGGPGIWIDAEQGIAMVESNEIAENAGGGCRANAVDGGDVTLAQNLVETNQSDGGGGMDLLAAWGGRLRVTGNRIGWNTADRGGGIDALAVGGTLSLLNNTLYQNRASTHGGLAAEAEWGSFLECAQNTVTENEAADIGVWIAVSPDSLGHVANNIFWGNLPLDYSGPASHHSVIGTGNNGGEGNLVADPRFADPESGDYRLTVWSPAVDMGDSDAVPTELATDADGRPRLRGAAVDPGAYEFVTARQLLEDLSAQLDLLTASGMVGRLTARHLDSRLQMADLFLRRGHGLELWSLYYIRGFIHLVNAETGRTVYPQAAEPLIREAKALYDQIERWGG